MIEGAMLVTRYGNRYVRLTGEQVQCACEDGALKAKVGNWCRHCKGRIVRLEVVDGRLRPDPTDRESHKLAEVVAMRLKR